MKIVRGQYDVLINLAKNRGYTEEEIQGCILSKNDKECTVDVDHEAYPRYKNNTKNLRQTDYQNNTTKIYNRVPFQNNIHIVGVGTKLKKLLSKIGIKATPNCSCNAKAKLMDQNGIEWCENNIDTIVGWLREEANNRKLLFLDSVGKLLVNRAIKNAKRNQ